MRKLPILVAAALLLVGALGAALATARDGLPEVQRVEHRWGAVGPDATEILTDLQVRNPGPVPLRVAGAEYDLSANGVHLGRGRVVEAADVPARGDGIVTLSTVVPTEAFLAWWASHVAAGERSVVAVDGSMTLVAAGVPVPVPIRTERAWTTGLAGGLASSLANCERARGLCVESSRHAWALAPDGAPELRSVLRVRNPTFLPLPLGTPDATLLLAGHPVATAAPGAPVLLRPGATDVALTIRFDEAALRAWWPAHVAACERSEAAVQIELAGGLLSLRAPVEPVATRFARPPPGCAA